MADNKYLYFSIAILLLILNLPFLFAQEEKADFAVFGLELEKLISLINGILASILFIVSLTAYKRDGRKRLLFVSIAFALFAVRSFLLAYELIGESISILDPIATVIDFFVILSFFYGVFKN
ncbi:MAG: hypothetical protein AABW50_03670 [Nanoarchaeota archaeon]